FLNYTSTTHIYTLSLHDALPIANRILEDAGDDIYRFRNGNILYALYGEPLKNMSRPYVSRVDDVLVIYNSSIELRNYLNDFCRKELLTGTMGFSHCGILYASR